MAPAQEIFITLGKSWGGEDVLVVYNLCECDVGLRTLREHATCYGDAQAEMLPFDINGGRQDAAFDARDPVLAGSKLCEEVLRRRMAAIPRHRGCV